ncbi:NADP-specific glutamate dehydrogenase [Marinoscillum furvescens]|uniref:Glutamate dehydrogenase n=1 Tax=Marinoscillum furvescens DSM 4134 TaxID=1122208 RepID=A0A3D9L093_MARFU|nr:NADP-specific glutamate dehydrogenase [Marinoscillum furvescens]RED94119.1 glutamate dehydrogenase/leucine dehydrogenase [Marinoscillum furvescens DSM 4134]
MANQSKNVEAFVDKIAQRNPYETEFIQAVREVAETIVPFIEDHPKYKESNVLERICEPERVVMFRVPWVNDQGTIEVNRGYRVQMNSAIGPYKGGLRFHPSVNLSILKFLAFEQVFKNSLTTLPLGGGKGGSDFNPKGKSDGEVMRFCQSFMTELARHIGGFTDIPAGDIGVGAREIGFMYGQYKKIKNEFTGVLTGKGLQFGGSLIRTEATGYGVVYFSKEMLETRGDSLEGKICAVSGSGNVAQYTIEKLIELGAKPVTVSDSGGCIYDKDGIDTEKLELIKKIKNEQRGRISEYADQIKGAEFHKGVTPWNIKVDLAYPCATQNELPEEDAKTLIDNGCMGVFEGANMPTTDGALHLIKENKLLFSPGKASNAGGVATSGLEMSQNSQRLYWTRDEVDYRLKMIMKSIHENCVEYGRIDDNYIDYVKGANIAGFVKVADAMIAQGVV